MSLGLLISGLVKVTACVFRPWIRDVRIEPWGDAKVAATGYSFPSGHTSYATELEGGLGFWQRKRHVWLMVLAFFMVALTMFSRNFLGVHTPQDVFVGLGVGIVAIILGTFAENWSDKDMSRDVILLVGGIVLCIAAALYNELKSYPLVYTEEGALLVDPAKMKCDTYEGVASVSAFVICRFIERRYFHFDEELGWKDRFIIGVIALIPGYFLNANMLSIVETWFNRSVGKFSLFGGRIIYTMLIVPFAMKYIAKYCSWVRMEKSRFDVK